MISMEKERKIYNVSIREITVGYKEMLISEEYDREMRPPAYQVRTHQCARRTKLSKKIV